MPKSLFLCFIFFSSLGLGDSENPVFVLTPALAIDYVASKTNCSPEDIAKIEVNRSKAVKKELAILTCALACGWGTCSSFVFYKNANQKLEYVGSVEGTFMSLSDDTKSDFPVLETQTKSGKTFRRKMSWILNSKSKLYEAL